MSACAIAVLLLGAILYVAVAATILIVSNRETKRAIREMEERLSRPNPLDGARIWGGS